MNNYKSLRIRHCVVTSIAPEMTPEKVRQERRLKVGVALNTQKVKNVTGGSPIVPDKVRET